LLVTFQVLVESNVRLVVEPPVNKNVPLHRVLF
jgi:hypothetical protein